MLDRLEAGAEVPPPLPLSLTDSVVGDLGRCEAYGVARAAETGAPTGWPAVAGSALNAYVSHVLFEGPVADPRGDLESIWCAEGHDSLVTDLAALIDDVAPEEGRARTDRLAALARSAGTFRVAPAWKPRVEVKVGCAVGGALTLRGRVDVMLGGPGTGGPTVLIEIKSGRPRIEHHEQLRHYMLLCALRHGEMPVAGAIWYPGDPGAPNLARAAARSPTSAGSGDGLNGGSGGGSVTEVHVPGSAVSAAQRVAARDRRSGRPVGRSGSVAVLGTPLRLVPPERRLPRCGCRRRS